MKKLIFAATLGLTMAATGVVQAQAKAAAPAAGTDANSAIVDAAFKKMDANGDGKVTKAEFKTFMADRFKAQQAELDTAFKALDTNGDGFISPEEASANPLLKEHFTEVDTNGDGKISPEELITAARAAQAKQAAE